MVKIKSIPETDYGYRAMTAALCLLGYIINHKKVYRLMGLYQLLLERTAKSKRRYVKYRRVNPSRPLQVLEMDIKFQWVQQHSRYAYILTVLDTFSRKVLDWMIGYSIKKEQVKQLWEQIIANHLQTADLLSKGITVELRISWFCWSPPLGSLHAIPLPPHNQEMAATHRVAFLFGGRAQACNFTQIHDCPLILPMQRHGKTSE